MKPVIELVLPADPLPSPEEARVHKLYWDRLFAAFSPSNFEDEAQRRLAKEIHGSLGIIRLSAPFDFRFGTQWLDEQLAELATPESAALALQKMRRPVGAGA